MPWSKHEAIALLLELDEYDAASVSKRNVDKKLPVDLLCKEKASNIRRAESVFRLLKAYPETVMSMLDVQKQQVLAQVIMERRESSLMRSR